MKKISSIMQVIIFLVAIGVLCSGCSTPSSPPNLKVTGIVTDKETGEPIVGARVADNIYAGSPSRPCQESWTDKEGKYVLETWYEEHSLVASAPGYPPKIVGFGTKNLSKETKIEINIVLEK
ncbi:MAG: carboxypeptidase regulatory-like domain-containing protein [Candidatus Omnitrophota bacterium]